MGHGSARGAAGTPGSGEEKAALLPGGDGGGGGRWAARRRRQVLLATLVCGYVAFSVVASVCRKLNADAYGTKLVFFRQQLIVLLYDIWVSAVVVYKLVARPGDITDAMRRYPVRLIALMSFLDAFADVLASVGGVNTPGSWQVLLGQLTVPFTMLFAFLLLRQRFSRVEYAGAFTIVAGSAVAVIPVFTGSDTDGQTRWYSVLIFCLALAPSAASNILKERAFKAVAFDVFFLSAMVTWLQLFLSWVFVPLLSLPGFGGIPMRDIPSTLRDGFYCLLGHTDIPVHEFDEIVGYCSPYVARVTFLNSGTDFVAGVFQLLIVKHGSAVLYVLAAALALPLSNMAFSWRAVMGSSVEEFSWYDVGGLVLVFSGFVIYRYRQLRLLVSPAAAVAAAAADTRAAAEGQSPLLEAPPDAVVPHSERPSL